MRNQIQEAFDTVQATSALKHNTQQFLSRKLYHRQAKRVPLKRLVLAAACIVVITVAGFYAYFTPVSAISIDVNPSIELGINGFDRVVSVDGYNEDGQTLASLLHVKYMPYMQAVETILNEQNMKTYIENGEVVSVTVAGGSRRQNEEMLTTLSQCAMQENVSCHAVSANEVSAAHGHGLSFGKYSAYLDLYALDPTVTVDDVKDLTMRQIRDRIGALCTGEAPSQGSGREGVRSGGSCGHGGGHGGYGWRGGHE